VVALHVHHGLQAAADDWLAHCESTCRRWSRAGHPVELAAHRLAEQPERGDSIEAWARRARYRALREMALQREIDLVLLGHHRRDQAETFVLQALRGAGAEGQSAMPRLARREGVSWARPWLEWPREAIEAYVRRHRLRHVDDASNDDVRFARNRLRATVWPSLVEAFSEAEASLAAAARRAQDASAALVEWAAIDLPAVSEGDALDVARWLALSDVRRSNALRAWLRERVGRAPPATLVERLLLEVGDRDSARWPAPSGELRSHRGLIRYQPGTLDLMAPAGAASTIAVDLARVGEHRVDAWRGTFIVRRVESGGIPSVVARSLVLRARADGDRFQAGPGRPPRSLKLQFQAAGVPAWQRSGPVVVGVAAIVYVPGLGLDARAVAAAGAPRVSIDWRAD
jgi:tRNA(Ile)-lysidine synthase